MEKKSSLICFLATLNILIALVGYNFVTSVFAQQMGTISQTITIPFRAFTLGVAILTIIFSLRKEKVPLTVKLLISYWGLLIIRFFYDVNLRVDINLSSSSARISQIWLYMICLSIIPLVALILSYKYINFKKLLYTAYILSSISILFTFIQNSAYQEIATERISANLALNTISAGHMGLTNIILGITLLYKHQFKIIIKCTIISLSILAFLILLRSGSRGPIMASILIIFFYIYAKSKYKIQGLLLIIALVSITYLFSNPIIESLNEISPILKERLFDRIDATSDRSPLYREAWKTFNQYPIFGHDFGLYNNGQIYYPHNIFLETLMQLGIFGAIILTLFIARTIRNSYFLIYYNSDLFWIGVLFIQSLSTLLVSGTFSMDPTFSLLIGLLSLITKDTYPLKTSQLYKKNNESMLYRTRLHRPTDCHHSS